MRFQPLADEDTRRLHDAVITVLGRVGVVLQNHEARALLRRAGAAVQDELVKIPERVVMEALGSAPSRVVLHDRAGTPAIVLGNDSVHFATGGTALYYYDLETGDRRLCTRQSIAETSRVCDSLPNIELVMATGVPSDVPPDVADRHQFVSTVTNLQKPTYSSAHTADGLDDIIEMASVIAGSREALRERPFLTTGIASSSPLCYSDEALGKLLVMSGAGLPSIVNCEPLAGATAPVTMASAIVVALAEGLAGLTVAQLNAPGAPVIMGGAPTTMDMQTTMMASGAPEMALMTAGMAQMCRHYGVPSYGTAGCSDSKVLDIQAAIEFTYSILSSALGGCNLVHGMGGIECAMTSSVEAFVLSDEIIGMARCIASELKVNDETLAVDLIERIGPRGFFLAEDHTLRHFREHYRSKLVDRQNYARWLDAGGKDMRARIAEKTRQIANNHYPPQLADGTSKELVRMLERCSSRRRRGGRRS